LLIGGWRQRTKPLRIFEGLGGRGLSCSRVGEDGKYKRTNMAAANKADRHTRKDEVRVVLLSKGSICPLGNHQIHQVRL